ncbi:hypothetical protein MHBO_004412, partial [Bonamia ostreae]
LEMIEKIDIKNFKNENSEINELDFFVETDRYSIFSHCDSYFSPVSLEKGEIQIEEGTLIDALMALDDFKESDNELLRQIFRRNLKKMRPKSDGTPIWLTESDNSWILDGKSIRNSGFWMRSSCSKGKTAAGKQSAGLKILPQANYENSSFDKNFSGDLFLSSC